MSCSLCDGSGWLDTDDSSVVIPCQCRSPSLSIGEADERMCIPPHFRDFIRPSCGWPIDERHKNYDTADWWQPGDPHSITFAGPAGTGKTSFAAELLRRQRREGSSASAFRFYRADQIIDDIFAARFEEKGAMKAELVKLEAIVIDDLGSWTTGSARAHAAWETVGEVIIQRLAAEKRTIITMNRSFSEVAEELPPVFDRLRGGLVVSVLGESLRGRELHSKKGSREQGSIVPDSRLNTTKRGLDEG